MMTIVASKGWCVPAIPSSLILCIVATRQGAPSGSLREALTGPGHDAKTFF
jgi:hypothetical protein